MAKRAKVKVVTGFVEIPNHPRKMWTLAIVSRVRWACGLLRRSIMTLKISG